MQQQIAALRRRIEGELEQVGDLQALQILRAQALGRKGEITQLMKGLGEASPEDRRALGQLINEAKDALESAFDVRRDALAKADLEKRLAGDRIDLTLPGRLSWQGTQHPLARTLQQMLGIFSELGFEVAVGPDVEDDFHNFQALNIPPDHPARDMQDTFWIDGKWLLRTHTSPVQVHTMMSQKPPVRIVAPGAVYRCDSDVTHSPMFHQVEGLLVDENISFADLKGVLTAFLQRLFGARLGVRFRPSFFPFTEPSTEVDIECVFCRGKGCRICKQSGFLEILGAGLVDPEVFRAVGYDANLTGFAFGVGVERVVMLQHGIDDIRHFYRSDLRFLRQF